MCQFGDVAAPEKMGGTLNATFSLPHRGRRGEQVGCGQIKRVVKFNISVSSVDNSVFIRVEDSVGRMVNASLRHQLAICCLIADIYIAND